MGIDVTSLIHSFGYLGVWAIVFAESGLLVGFFLPGDSLLFTAGFVASQGIMNVWVLTVGCIVAAVLGDNLGYATGHRWGRRLFHREDSRFFHKKHLLRAQSFYHKHGRKTIILARFIPFVRTFAPIVAGIGSMNYRVFFLFNIIGGVTWTVSFTLLGYYLGRLIPNVEQYLSLIIIFLVVGSLLISAWHFYQDARTR
jgi:membrane-associated protein